MAGTKDKAAANMDDLEKQEVLQAVVLADTFDKTLAPLTDSSPTVCNKKARFLSTLNSSLRMIPTDSAFCPW